MLKTHRIALVTNNREATLLARHAGFARFAYNSALADFKEGLDRREWLGERTLRPRFNALKESVAPWSTDLAQNAGKYAIIDLGQVCGPLGGVPQGEEGVGRRGRAAGMPKPRHVCFPRFHWKGIAFQKVDRWYPFGGFGLRGGDSARERRATGKARTLGPV